MRYRTIAVISFLLISLAGCGSDGTEVATTTEAPTTTEASTSEAPTTTEASTSEAPTTTEASTSEAPTTTEATTTTESLEVGLEQFANLLNAMGSEEPEVAAACTEAELAAAGFSWTDEGIDEELIVAIAKCDKPVVVQVFASATEALGDQFTPEQQVCVGEEVTNYVVDIPLEQVDEVMDPALPVPDELVAKLVGCGLTAEQAELLLEG